MQDGSQCGTSSKDGQRRIALTSLIARVMLTSTIVARRRLTASTDMWGEQESTLVHPFPTGLMVGRFIYLCGYVFFPTYLRFYQRKI